MKGWQEDILLQILLQRKFWMHIIGDKTLFKDTHEFCRSCDSC